MAFKNLCFLVLWMKVASALDIGMVNYPVSGWQGELLLLPLGGALEVLVPRSVTSFTTILPSYLSMSTGETSVE